jgi:hypothetical protein
MHLRSQFMLARENQTSFLQALRDAQPAPTPHIPYNGVRLDGQLPEMPQATNIPATQARM